MPTSTAILRRAAASVLQPRLKIYQRTRRCHAPRAVTVCLYGLRLYSQQEHAESVELASNLHENGSKTDQKLFVPITDLPTTCPGCGAPSQTVAKESVGYYDLTSKRMLAHFGVESKQAQSKARNRKQDEIFQLALKRMGRHSSISELPVLSAAQAADRPSASSIAAPICNRCHQLIYEHRGEAIIHPSMDSIQAMIEESPYVNNHIYHVVDAADFPMSLIPNLVETLDLPRLRSRNRRSKGKSFNKSRAAEVSFIITRSDLLAPKKEQVDTMMPYLQTVLRDALGKTNQQLRLGNVRCVSARRAWWTPTLKEEIWDRGGAGWMVGKVNVGKSALYEAVFPKGRNKHVKMELADLEPTATNGNPVPELTKMESRGYDLAANDTLTPGDVQVSGSEATQDASPLVDDIYDEESLLPLARIETAYPEMPTVSSLPGTTASPIRIPYGNGKGELIDLPGIHRSSLEEYVKPEHHHDMVMKHRIVPESYTLKPGMSLILGGIIRITPQVPPGHELIFMAYPFVPDAFKPHATGTHKAIAIQNGVYSSMTEGRAGQAYDGSIESIATQEAQKQMASAGRFPLSWDVTKRRTGPLTERVAGNMKTDRLPFVIYSTDILIEGVGWIELTCQVRRAMLETLSMKASGTIEDGLEPHENDALPLSKEDFVPTVEVISPTGKFIGSRRPMNAWEIGGPKKLSPHNSKTRPRQAMSKKKRQLSSQSLRHGG